MRGCPSGAIFAAPLESDRTESWHQFWFLPDGTFMHRNNPIAVNDPDDVARKSNEMLDRLNRGIAGTSANNGLTGAYVITGDKIFMNYVFTNGTVSDTVTYFGTIHPDGSVFISQRDTRPGIYSLPGFDRHFEFLTCGPPLPDNMPTFPDHLRPAPGSLPPVETPYDGVYLYNDVPGSRGLAEIEVKNGIFTWIWLGDIVIRGPYTLTGDEFYAEYESGLNPHIFEHFIFRLDGNRIWLHRGEVVDEYVKQ